MKVCELYVPSYSKRTGHQLMYLISKFNNERVHSIMNGYIQ